MHTPDICILQGYGRGWSEGKSLDHCLCLKNKITGWWLAESAGCSFWSARKQESKKRGKRESVCLCGWVALQIA